MNDIRPGGRPDPGPTHEPCISVNQLRVIYNQGKSNEVRSLDGVSLDIYPEEFVLIFGPSGCGKSTLLYGISGLQAPTGGKVAVMGRDLSGMSKKERTGFHRSVVGMVFQAFYLIDTLTVIENVCLPMVFRNEDIREARVRAMRLLRRFGIAEQADKFPNQLSGGQKQRVSIARALINDPDIILADEPVGNLDSESARNVLDIFREINSVDRKTIIMVTHNPEHLVYADRVVYMKDGRKVDERVNRDKRGEMRKERKTTEVAADSPVERIPIELEMLMRSFKSLSPTQIGMLIVPFKAKQVLNYLLSELTEEQVKSAEQYLQDYLFKTGDARTLAAKLDFSFEKGGAGWNRTRANSFAARAEQMMRLAAAVTEDVERGSAALSEHIIRSRSLALDGGLTDRFRKAVRARVASETDRNGLTGLLDAPVKSGGVGLYRPTAEKIAWEVELIMLLGYSPLT